MGGGGKFPNPRELWVFKKDRGKKGLKKKEIRPKKEG